MTAGENPFPKMPHGSALEPLSVLGPVVSSSHLAQASAVPELSELEFALTMANNAFQRWIARCTAAAGEAGLSPLEVQVLHLVNHRSRPKTLADLCLILNIEDTHLVTYAIKKLAERKLVASGRKGKEKTITITTRGEALCRRYGEIREALLAQGFSRLGVDPKEMSRLAALLRVVSGSYDQAARSAAAM